MSEVISIASVGMQNDLSRLDTISQNLANVSTPSYKKQIAVGGAFRSHLDGVVASQNMAAAQLQNTALDFSAGPMRYTGNLLDVAIEGDSFFEVDTPTGPAYTRQGSLRTDLQGRLVGSQQLPLAGVAGAIVLGNGPFTVQANGDVMQGERLAGRLKCVRFDHISGMLPLGNGLYQAGSARIADAQSVDALRVGFQEGSNVNSPQEMVRLTETVRHFESLQKLVQGYDESLEKTIRKLGEF